MAQIFLSPWKQLIFEMFVSIDLLSPEEMILSFARLMSKSLVDPYKLFADIFHVRQNEKIIAHKIFFIGKISFFFSKICFFNNFLGPNDLFLLLPK